MVQYSTNVTILKLRWKREGGHGRKAREDWASSLGNVETRAVELGQCRR